MHVLILSDTETQGGAAIAASRLAETLVGVGHRVTRVVHTSDAQEHPWETISIGFSPYLLLIKRILRGPVWDYLAGSIYQKRLEKILADLSPDIINVHNLHVAAQDGWSPRLANVCANYGPTVWTLHDMWSFTGRCAYNGDCFKYIRGCDRTCPTSDQYPSLSPRRIRSAWRYRRKALINQHQLAAITPSRWLVKEAVKGLWTGHLVVAIPNGLPLELYRPLDRGLARLALGIEPSGIILLIVAEKLSDRRKSIDILKQALTKIHMRPITLLVMGHGRLLFDMDQIHIHHLGYIDHEQTKVLAYNASNVLIHPALQDNLPNVVMEAISCGTPVVGFRTGGVAEMVREKQTGWVAAPISPSGLAKAINSAITDLRNGIDLRMSCRKIAEEEYSDGLQAHRYLDVFQQVISQAEKKKQ